MNIFKFRFILLLSLLLGVHPSFALQFYWAQSTTNSISVPITLTQAGAVTVAASVKADVSLAGTPSLFSTTVRLDGDPFIVDGRTGLSWQNSGEVDLGQSDTFRRTDIAAGNHTISMDGVYQNIAARRSSLLVILEDESESTGSGDLEQQIQDMANAINQEITDRQDADAILAANLAALQTALEQRIGQLEIDLLALTTQTNANAQEIAQLRADLEEAMDGLQSVLETRIAQLEARLDNLPQGNSRPDTGRLDALEDELDSLRSRLSKQEKKVATLKSSDSDELTTYLISAGIAVGGSAIVNAVWPRNHDEEAARSPEKAPAPAKP
jgi:hypothetical protein